MTSAIHGKNDFAKGSKILLDVDLKIILLDHQNNFVKILKTMGNATKNFDILVTSLSILHFILIIKIICRIQQNSTKFFYLYPVKILDLSAKSFLRVRFEN